MRDVVYQPGAKTSNPSMPNDMVCPVPEGELRVKQSGGMEFFWRRRVTFGPAKKASAKI
jgi:hypothetical protein